MKKSAKDIAFEKERVKFRSEIRELTNCLNTKQKQMDELNEILREKDQIITQQEEWIERLLEYTELEKEDMQKLINNEKDKAEIREKLSSTIGIIGMMSRKSFFDLIKNGGINKNE